jgi:hypothetical protein
LKGNFYFKYIFETFGKYTNFTLFKTSFILYDLFIFDYFSLHQILKGREFFGGSRGSSRDRAGGRGAVRGRRRDG